MGSFSSRARIANRSIAFQAIHRAFLAIALLLPMALAAHTAHATSLDVLYSFCTRKNTNTGVCNDGSDPVAGLIEDGSGNLYGTTAGGGKENSGTVFEVSGNTETVLYDFCRRKSCIDGSNPLAGLIEDKSGNLYGTTQNGGLHGSGILFELSPAGDAWTETILHHFCSEQECADGGDLVAGLLMDSAGNLYGTTSGGGKGAYAVGGGTVFEMTLDKTTNKWTEQVLYKFCNISLCADGDSPQAGLAMDGAGNLYGTTENGGANDSGAVFKLSKNPTSGKWKETVLYSFCSQPGSSNVCYDGASPVAGLAIDGSGHLYGTTMQGGVGNPGYGTVFKLTHTGSHDTYGFDVLYRFCPPGTSTCGDGLYPKSTLILDGSENLYGTTYSTAYSTNSSQYAGAGTVFRITPGGTETLLFRFCGNQCNTDVNDGLSPEAGVIMDSAGNLFGTTAEGGRHNAGGEVFELKN